MSSKQMTERNRLEQLQTDYRKTWHQFTVAVELLQSAASGANSNDEFVTNAHAQVEEAGLQYRDARNALADWLLLEDAGRDASEEASRSAHPVAQCQAA